MGSPFSGYRISRFVVAGTAENGKHPKHTKLPRMYTGLYRVVQLNFTPEIEVFYVLVFRSLSIFSMMFLEYHMECGILQFPV